MLNRLHIRGFKSLADVSFDPPRLAVLFGPNAAGKSNLLDAIQALSRIGTQRTLADALAEPIRGYPLEAFTFPSGGMAELLGRDSGQFVLEADVTVGKEQYRYWVEVSIEPGSGRLSTTDEYLAQLGAKGEPKRRAAIERVGSNLHIRRKSKPAHPRQEPIGLNHSILSDPRLGGVEYRWLDQVRKELSDWRTYYLDPRVAMRAAQPPSDVRDIGVLGGDIAPFLYKLRAEHRKHFDAVVRTLRSVVPSVEELTVDLDKHRGTLDLLIRQGGVDYSSRIVSEGTLRVLALCAITVNPWGGSLLAFEEPEMERYASPPARADRPAPALPGAGAGTTGCRYHALTLILRCRAEGGSVAARGHRPFQCSAPRTGDSGTTFRRYRPALPGPRDRCGAHGRNGGWPPSRASSSEGC